MKDYMLTVFGNAGSRDVQVNAAPDMHAAIAVAERETGCRVDHGRSGVLSGFDPAIIIDWESGHTEYRHDRSAEASMQIVNPFLERFTVAKGEGRK